MNSSYSSNLPLSKSLARQGIEYILSPKQQRRPVPSLLYNSFVLWFIATRQKFLSLSLHTVFLCVSSPLSFLLLPFRSLTHFLVFSYLSPFLSLFPSVAVPDSVRTLIVSLSLYKCCFRPSLCLSLHLSLHVH